MDQSLPGRLACFHAQQAAEKALKASLVVAGIEFRKTHDLVVLAALQPEPLRSAVLGLELQLLQPWAVDARYPADVPEANAEEAGEVVGVASRLVDVVAAVLAAGPDLRRADLASPAGGNLPGGDEVGDRARRDPYELTHLHVPDSPLEHASVDEANRDGESLRCLGLREQSLELRGATTRAACQPTTGLLDCSVDRPPTPRYRPPLARRGASSCRAGPACGRSKVVRPTHLHPRCCTSPARPSSRPSGGRGSVTARDGTEAPASITIHGAASGDDCRGMGDAVVPIAKPPRAVDSDAAVTDPRLRLPARRWGACGDRPAAPVVAPRPTQIGSPRLAEPRCRPPISTSSRATHNRHILPVPTLALAARHVVTPTGTSGATVFVARPRALALVTYAVARTLNLGRATVGLARRCAHGARLRDLDARRSNNLG